MIVSVRNIAVVLILLVSVSCQDLKRSDKPKDLISEQKMIDVLTELSLLHAARNYNKQKLEDVGVDPDTYIYEKFDIDSLQFARSNNWYAEQYGRYERIYDSVKARVQLLKTRLDSLREIEVEIEDSLRQVERDSVKKLDSLKDGGRQREFRQLLEDKEDSLIAPPVSSEDDRS